MGVRAWFQDDSSTLHLLHILFLSLYQLHLRSSGIRSQRLETPPLENRSRRALFLSRWALFHTCRTGCEWSNDPKERGWRNKEKDQWQVLTLPPPWRSSFIFSKTVFVHQVAASPDHWSPLLGMALKVSPFIPRTGDWGESQDTGLDFMVCPGNQLSDLLKSPDWVTALRGLILQTAFSPSDPEPSLAWLYPPLLSVAPRLLNSPRDPLVGLFTRKSLSAAKDFRHFSAPRMFPPPIPTYPSPVPLRPSQIPSSHGTPLRTSQHYFLCPPEWFMCLSCLSLVVVPQRRDQLLCATAHKRVPCWVYWIALNEIILNFY